MTKQDRPKRDVHLKRLRAEQARTEAELSETQRKLDRSRERNKQLKDQRARLAEELAHEQIESRPGKRGKGEGRQTRSRKGEHTGRKCNARFVT